MKTLITHLNFFKCFNFQSQDSNLLCLTQIHINLNFSAYIFVKTLIDEKFKQKTDTAQSAQTYLQKIIVQVHF